MVLCSQHFLLICSARQSRLDLLSPTRKPDYIYRSRDETHACPCQTRLLLNLYVAWGLLSSVLPEGKHVPAGKKPYVANWELH